MVTASPTEITPQFIKLRSGAYDLEIVYRLDLPNEGITGIDNLDECSNLEELDLSHNQITRIEGLDHLKKLKRLDLSFNRISRLENLGELTSLEELRLQGNNISSIDDVACLTKLPNLRAIYFRDPKDTNRNPLCGHPSYHTVILSYLSRLTMLDGEHMKLQKSVQQALLDEICKMEDEWVPPPRSRWLEGLDGPQALPDVQRARRMAEDLGAPVEEGIEECDAVLRRANELLRIQSAVVRAKSTAAVANTAVAAPLNVAVGADGAPPPPLMSPTPPLSPPRRRRPSQ